ncbi:microtubule-associated protein futsch-like isoform X3 [Ostrea edulis]|uniref:microtubule-associated protein futsch-like isoform X3 n=1 Tax=Ostrea edulis TaxID=37623 RepID=UPI0024AEDACF|nr:microtubule-associated protein futsch-like isoform X3 [Ostrea edulis]
MDRDLRDSIIHDIDELLQKLTDNGEESLLITANGTSLYVTGSKKGKKFLTVNQHIVEQFKEFCYVTILPEETPKIRTKLNPMERYLKKHCVKFPSKPTSAITVVKVEEINYDDEMEQPEDINNSPLQTKLNSFQVFNIESQEYQARKWRTSHLHDTSRFWTTGKPKQGVRKSVKCQVHKEQMSSQEKSKGSMDEEISLGTGTVSDVALNFIQAESADGNSMVIGKLSHFVSSEPGMPKESNPSRQSAEKTRKGSSIQTGQFDSQKDKSKNFADSQQNTGVRNRSSTVKTASDNSNQKSNSDVKNSYVKESSSSEAGPDMVTEIICSAGDISNQTDGCVSETMVYDTSNAHTDNDENHLQQIDSVNLHVKTTNESSHHAVYDENSDVAKGNEEGGTGNSCQKDSCPASSESQHVVKKCDKNNPTSPSKEMDSQESIKLDNRDITCDSKPVKCVESCHKNSDSTSEDKSHDTACDLRSDVTESADKETILYIDSQVKPAEMNPKETKTWDLEKELKKPTLTPEKTKSKTLKRTLSEISDEPISKRKKSTSKSTKPSCTGGNNDSTISYKTDSNNEASPGEASQKSPSKKPTQSAAADKSQCDVKNLRIDLKALAMELARRKQKK